MISFFHTLGSDWTMVVITAIYVIATILICLFNGLSAYQSKKQINESKRQFDEQTRACIDISFVIIRNSDMTFRISNVGKSYARQISVVISNDFFQLLDTHERNLFGNLPKRKFSLSPNESIYFCFGDKLDFDKYKKNPVTFTVSYKDPVKVQEENFQIDLSGYDGSYLYSSPQDDIANSLRNINNLLQYIVNPIDGLKIITSNKN